MNIKKLNDKEFLLITTNEEHNNLNMDNIKEELSKINKEYIKKKILIVQTNYLNNLVYIKIKIIN